MTLAPVARFRAVVKEHFGVDIGYEKASDFLDSAWLQEHGSTDADDVVQEEWNNTGARFLCRRNVMFPCQRASAGCW